MATFTEESIDFEKVTEVERERRSSIRLEDVLDPNVIDARSLAQEVIQIRLHILFFFKCKRKKGFCIIIINSFLKM